MIFDQSFLKMDRFNMLFPEWQGYGGHQEVYHGALHFCNHVTPATNYDQVHVPDHDVLKVEEDILGRSSLLNLLSNANKLLEKARPSHLFMIGGTCACEIAPVSFLNHQYDNDLAVFWFDAHGDLNTPDSSPSKRLHGMPLRSLIGEGDTQILSQVRRILNTEQVALVGARDLDPAEVLFIETKQIPVFQPKTGTQITELIDFARKSGFTKAYIHFDLDVLDPLEFPHVLVATPNGLSISHAVQSLNMISKHLEVVGCSIVEYCPKGEGGKEQLKRLMVEGFGIDV